jgi:hypothetical protein
MTAPYVINLDKSTERWNQIQQDWKGVFPLNRVSAVEASPGWIGCALSHIKIIEEAKMRGDPYVLVWEDDCIPRKRNGEHTSPHVIKQLWDSVLSKLSQNRERWDIVLGATSRIFETPTKDPVLSTNMVKVYQIKHGFCAHWILYNASIYDKMIAWKNVQPIQIDVYMYNIARIFVTSPFLAEQREGYSFIENVDTSYNHLFNKSEKQLQLQSQSIIHSLPKVSFKLPKQ